MQYDPVQDDPRYQSIFDTIDAEVEDMLAHKGYTRKNIGQGWIQLFWSAKQALLKEKYHIDWKSEGELNPDVVFD